jgi:glucose-6-phosphate isomerase
MTITPAAAHDALTEAAEALKSQRIEGLFDTSPDRASDYRCAAAGLTLDFSKHLMDNDAWQALLKLSDTQALKAAFASLIDGEIINASEHRPALHTLLRGTARDRHPEKSREVEDTLVRMAALVDSIHSGASTGSSGQPFTDVVNLGIGGSDLGPRLVCEALYSEAEPLKAHFVANIDPDDLDSTLAPLNPETTLIIICSKSFSTEETLSNAERAIRWLQAGGIQGQAVGAHLIAVTTQVAKAGDWHIPPERCFPLWDWVGGRYSLWSAIGISIALALGWQSFQRLLDGAHSLDTHTNTASPAANLPMIMALLELWQTHYLGANTHAVLPYAQRLAHLAGFPAAADHGEQRQARLSIGRTAGTRHRASAVGLGRHHRTALLLSVAASGHTIFQRRHYPATALGRRRSRRASRPRCPRPGPESRADGRPST